MIIVWVLVLSLLSATPVWADLTPGHLDSGFDPGSGANDHVLAIAIQPDGKVLTGGAFSAVDGAARNYLARLNADGSLDTSFVPASDVDGWVHAIAVQADGKVLVGGACSTGTDKCLVRLNADGNLDTSFAPGVDKVVRDIAIQSDGKVLIGGEFTTVDSVARNYIARINPDGSLDASFDPGGGPSSGVHALALQADGKVVIAGNFSTVGGVTRIRVARLNSDGSLDDTFNPDGPNKWVDVVALQADGKVLIGGSFTSCNGTGRLRVARLMSDGQVDAHFGNTTNGPDNTVQDMAVQEDGKVILGGEFTTVGGTARNYIARLQTNGALDATFAPGAGLNGPVYALALQGDGAIVVGGAFQSAGGQPRQRVARFLSDGNVDTGFDPGVGTNNQVKALALQPDGKIIIAGAFTKVDSVARLYIARLNADGSLDNTFDPEDWPDASLTAVALQADGKIVIAGSFTHIGDTARPGFARLNADGSLDATFDPGDGPNGLVWDILVQEDGNLLIGGDFTFYDSHQSQRIARIKADDLHWGYQVGDLDTAFDSAVGPNAIVRSVALQPGAKVVIGGDFSTYRTAPAKNIARLNGGDDPQTHDIDAPDGQVGEPYSFQFTATGLPVPTWASVPGSLPAGLSLDATTDVLSGTPTAAGSYTVQVWACNYLTGCGDASLSVDIAAPAEVELSVVVDGEGSGTVASQPPGIACDDTGGDCTETYLAYQSTVVTLTATADEGSRLLSWSGACSGIQTTCQVTMDVTRSVTATFGLDVVQVFLPLVLRNP